MLKTLLELELAYDNLKITSDPYKLEYWAQEFKGVPYPLMQIAVKQYIRTNHFKPSIAGLYEILTELMIEPSRQPYRAWDNLLKFIGDYGKKNMTRFAEINKLELSDPIIETINQVGFKRVYEAQASERPFIYKEFKEILEKKQKIKYMDELTAGTYKLPDNTNQIKLNGGNEE